MVTHHPKDGRWPSTIKNMVTSLSKDGNPFSKGWLHTIPRMVTHQQKNGQPPNLGWSSLFRGQYTTISRTVNLTWSLTLAQPNYKSYRPHHFGCRAKASITYLFQSKNAFEKGKSYLAERFHQIMHYLAEQYCQIAHYLAEHLLQINNILSIKSS